MRMHRQPREVERYHDINISNPTDSRNFSRYGLNRRPTCTRTRKLYAGRCHKLCEWVRRYNFHNPHGTLNGKTACEALIKIYNQVRRHPTRNHLKGALGTCGLYR